MKSHHPAFVFTLAGLIILGCREKCPDFERTVLSINNQNIEILTAFNLFDSYLSDSDKHQNNISRSSIKNIYNPIGHEILKNAEAAFLFETIKIPYEANDYLRNEIELLRASDLISIIQESFSRITKELPGPDTKIIILPASSLNQPTLERIGIPISGITLGSGKIILSIDPTFQNWEDFLPYCIAHEYHHSTWTSRNWVSADFSLLDYLVLEGRADLFAKELYNTVTNPLTDFLTLEQESEIWMLIKNEIFEEGHERINQVMFGTDKIPFGSGYNIGFNIVRHFKENNPETVPQNLIDLDPEEILIRSGYNDYLTKIQ